MTKKSVIKIISFLVCAFTIFTFVGCSENNENEINVYTGIEEEFVAEYIKAFQKECPDIKVNIIRDSTGVVASKLTVEREDPRADVMWGVNSSNVLFLDDYGLYKEYKPSNLENIDSRFYDTKNEIPHWVGMSLTNVVFTVNVTELEKEGLDIPYSFDDLLKPEYKGRIIMPNPTSSGTGLSILSALKQLKGEEGYEEYMEKLNKNIGQYSHSGSAPTKQTAQGEFLIGIGMDFLSIQMEKSNEHIKTIFPKEGSGWDVEASALINKPNIKEAAKTFYEWCLSEEAMKLYSENRSMVALKNGKYSKEEFKESVDNMIQNDLIWQSKNRKLIVDEWDKKYGVGE